MTIIRVCDVETSGLPEDEVKGIVEIGWVDLDLETNLIGNPVSHLVNPGHPIPAHNRAVHHIGNEAVADAITPAGAVALLLNGLGDGDVLAAHKADFEKAFIDAGERPWLCTWKVSLRAWPDYVSHSNQALRYELDVDGDPDFDAALAMPPHRSLPDAYVTAHILRRQLGMGRSLERLIEISAEPGFLSRFSFGKYRGKSFREVAASDPRYLEWIVEKSDLDADVKFSAKHWLDRSRQKVGESA